MYVLKGWNSIIVLYLCNILFSFLLLVLYRKIQIIMIHVILCNNVFSLLVLYSKIKVIMLSVKKQKQKQKPTKKKGKNKTVNKKTKYDIIRKTFIKSCYWRNPKIWYNSFIKSCYWRNPSNFNLVQLLSVHNIKKLNNLRKCLFLLKKIFFRYLLFNARLCLYCCVYVNIIKYYTRFVYLQLPIQSVPITTKVWGLNPAHGEVCPIQYYVIKCVTDLRQIGGFLLYSGFLH